MRTILISGKQGSGKSSLAKNLVSEFKAVGITPIQCRFAGPLYEMQEAIRGVAEKYGIPMDEKEGVLLQLLGTQWGRRVKGENVWINALKYFTNGADFVSHVFIVDDCRFKNELAAFDGAFKVRLVCEEEIRKSRTHAWRENTTHQSEIDLDDIEDCEFNLVLNTRMNSKDVVLRDVFEGAKYFWNLNGNDKN